MKRKFQTFDGKAVDIDDYIVEYMWRWYVATYDQANGQYQGPLHPGVGRRSGCSGFTCRSLEGLRTAGGYVYTTRSAAVKRAIEMFGLEKAPR